MTELCVEPPEVVEQRPARPWLRRVVWYGYLAALVVAVFTGLIPGGRLTEAGWILVGIAAYAIDRPWRDHVRVVLDWLPLIFALLVYDFTRDLADTVGMPLRMAELADADRWMFNGTVPTVWLQDHLAGDGEPWWTPITGVVYTTHFILPWLVAAVFYVYSRPRWARYMRRILLLSYLALVTYVLVPAAPPWFASREGVIDEGVRRITGFGLGLMPSDVSADWLESQGNYVAALPSLHAGFALLVSLTLWPVLTKWWMRVPLVVFPPAMAFTLIYGGEHYVIDVLVGWAYVAVTMLLAWAWENRKRLMGKVEVPAPAAELAPDTGRVVGHEEL